MEVRTFADRKTKSKVTVTYYTRDTACTSSCPFMAQPDRRDTQQFVVSMHDLFEDLHNDHITSAFGDENTHVNCLPTTVRKSA